MRNPEEHDEVWRRGNRAAWRRVLGQALAELGYDDPSVSAGWVCEREDVIAMLRVVCDNHGDNDWQNDLHLGDVIDKHLACHLPTVPDDLVERLRTWYDATSMDPPYAKGSPGARLFEACTDYFRNRR